MAPRSMHLLISVVNEDMKYERWRSEFLLWESFSPTTLSSILVTAFERQRDRASVPTTEKITNKQTNKEKPSRNYQHQSRVLHREEEGDQKPGGHTGHVRKIQRYLWLDGRMDGHMTTCTQRATSHKCSILFSNDTLQACASSHFGPLGSGLFGGQLRS